MQSNPVQSITHDAIIVIHSPDSTPTKPTRELNPKGQQNSPRPASKRKSKQKISPVVFLDAKTPYAKLKKKEKKACEAYWFAVPKRRGLESLERKKETKCIKAREDYGLLPCALVDVGLALALAPGPVPESVPSPPSPP